MADRELTDALGETLSLFEAGGEPLTTTDVAGAVGLGRRSAYERLDRLVDRDRLETKKVGANARVWWRPPPPADGAGRAHRAEQDHARGGSSAAVERAVPVLDRVDDAVLALDADRRLVHLNERATELLDRSAGELLGRRVRDAFPGAVAPRLREEFERALNRGVSVTFEQYYPPLATWFEVAAYPSDSGLSVLLRDVTGRKERERELRRYETVVETVADGAYVLDADDRFVLVNDAHCTLTGYDREQLLGAHVSLVTTDGPPDRPGSSDGVTTVETELRTADGGTVPVETRVAPVTLGDGEDGRAGVVRDITDRRERERELGRYETIVETVADGIYTIGEDGRFAFVNDSYKEMIGLPSADLLGCRSTVLAEMGVLDPEIFERAGELNAQLRDGTRESASLEAEIRRPDGTVLEGEATFNRLSVAAGEERVGVVRDITDRKERERALERQGEQLAALDSLNRVVREITAAVVDQSTRAEIEATVCERLAASESYLFAWIGEVDPASDTVRLRTEAGVEGYLDDIVISVDPDDERSEGATGRAFRTGEMQTTRETATDPRYDVWRGELEEHGFRSSAAIPIVHEGSVYGTLNVYTARPDAFDGQERAVVEQLGAVVGHAIAATERKQALMSTEVIELGFRIPEVFEAVDTDAAVAGTATLDHFLAVGDDEFLVYGTATPEAVDGLYALVEALPHWQAVTVRDGSGERPFELRLAEPPVLSAVAGVGGAIERASIDGGDYEMTVHVPPSGDVGRIIDTVEAAYPTVQLRRRRQVTRDLRRADRTDGLLGGLTDRQRTVLETAYRAGFFDWPRAASGGDVAESLGIAAPTFHQHLRKAEQDVFGRLLSD